MGRPTRAEYVQRLKDRTRKQILTAALRIAKRYGLQAVKRDAVAHEAGCGTGTVNFHFQTVRYLHDAVLTEAVRTRALRLIAEGIVNGYPAVASVPADLRSEAMASYNN